MAARKGHKYGFVSARHEKILQAYVDEAGAGAVTDYDDLPRGVRDALDKVRQPTPETLWSDVNRWLLDKRSERLGDRAPRAPRLAGKKLDTLVSQTYSRLGSGIQVDIMDLGKISDAAVAAYVAASDHEAGVAAMERAMATEIEHYRTDKPASTAPAAPPLRPKVPPRLLASAPDVTGIHKMIRDFYGGEDKPLDPRGPNVWALLRGDGTDIPNVRVVKHGGRYRFEQVVGGAPRQAGVAPVPEAPAAPAPVAPAVPPTAPEWGAAPVAKWIQSRVASGRTPAQVVMESHEARLAQNEAAAMDLDRVRRENNDKRQYPGGIGPNPAQVRAIQAADDRFREIRHGLDVYHDAVIDWKKYGTLPASTSRSPPPLATDTIEAEIDTFMDYVATRDPVAHGALSQRRDLVRAQVVRHKAGAVVAPNAPLPAPSEPAPVPWLEPDEDEAPTGPPSDFDRLVAAVRPGSMIHLGSRTFTISPYAVNDPKGGVNGNTWPEAFSVASASDPSGFVSGHGVRRLATMSPKMRLAGWGMADFAVLYFVPTADGRFKEAWAFVAGADGYPRADMAAVGHMDGAAYTADDLIRVWSPPGEAR
jgi:hypothetical protein